MTIDLAHHPELIHATAFVAPNATVLGQVTVGPEASIWFGAVVRGDIERVFIGARSNIQDNCVVHVDLDHPCIIGEGVTVGHGAIVHGATIEDNVLIGMGAIILNGAVIGRDSIIGAGAVVTENSVIPPRSLVLGIPGKVRRAILDEEVPWIQTRAEHYVRYSRAYLGITSR